MVKAAHQPVAWVVALGLLLLPLLAIFQYRWVGGLSELERQRMERSLRAATDSFADDLDDLLTEIYWTFHLSDPDTDRIGAQLAQAYAEWSESFPFAGLVENSYWIELETRNGPRISRVSSADGSLEPVEWPGELGDIRDQLAARVLGGGMGRRSRAVPPIQDRIPAIVVYQEETRRPAWTVVALSSEVLFDELIPAWVNEYFGSEGSLDYNLWIVEQANPEHVVWASDPALPVDLSSFDDDEGTFGFEGRLERNLDDAADQRWRIIVRHQAGSLESAVSAIRRRNLFLGFGIVGLLGASILALFASTRKAKALALQQMEFVAGISHELRTPIAGISSLSENLADGLVNTPEETRRYGSAIHRDSRRLAAMVERVLNFATVESGGRRYSPTTVAVADLVNESVEPLASTADPNGRVRVEIAPDVPPLLVDRPAMKSALGNLVANALKFGDEGTPVTIRATAAGSRRGRQVCISVRDRGPGIPSSELKRIFEPFYRGKRARDDQIEGSGLGLSLVKRIVTAHGGTVRASSSPGDGSCFTIRLPAADAESATVTPGAPESLPAAGSESGSADAAGRDGADPPEISHGAPHPESHEP